MLVIHADMWATALPCDLLLDIFRRLGSTAIIRCASVCRPWRRAIIDNARCLRPRPDRFLRDLLLGFLDNSFHVRPQTATLVPSAENNVLAAVETIIDVGPEDAPLALRDGFLLLRVRGKTVRTDNDRLCLCNLQARSCRFLSAATALGKNLFNPCSYVLTTAYDDDPTLPDADGGADGSSDVRILAVRGQENGVAFQTFSSASGVWGPVKRSAKLVEEDLDQVCVQTAPRQSVVCCGGGSSVVYWLVHLFPADEEADYRMCLVAMDTRTERTWTTELPKEWEDPFKALVLATSKDGRQLSLIAAQSQGAHHEIEVWVLAGDDSRWTLQLTMDVQSWLFTYSPDWGEIWLTGFCPRSGCLFAVAMEHEGGRRQFVIGVDGPELATVDGNSRPQKLVCAPVRVGLVNVHIKDEVLLA